MEPQQLPELDPAWSRFIEAPDAEGVTRRWHVLDTGPLLAQRGEVVTHTLLCVHGNPTWSYLWRRVIAQAPQGWRVIAVDQLGMGWSERPAEPRRLAQRVEDLCRLTDALEVTGPVATLAHDWGGSISLGWAQQHRDQLLGVVLTNTAVHQPESSQLPAALRVARAPGLLARVCQDTSTFVRATTGVSVPPPPKAIRDAFAQPYRTAEQRRAVADFVRDIPVGDGHPSKAALDAIAAGTQELQDVPALFVWGTRDPVFQEKYLRDLISRLPHADVQRYTDASHLVLEDRPEGVDVIWDWLGRVVSPGTATVLSEAPRVPVAVNTADPAQDAVVDLQSGRRITFGQLTSQVDDVARGLAARGVQAGDRVAVLVPPGIELTVLVYALWRIGAVIVIADAGLGLGRLAGALRSAGPDHIIGIPRALALSGVTRLPGSRIRVSLGGGELDELAAADREGALPVEPVGSSDAAVLFTSGATGPPKGVVYTRDQLGTQVALLRDTFGLQPGTGLVAAFAPFALYGPALGMTSVVPAVDVTAPHTLTAVKLAQAVYAISAEVVFAAPAALRNIVATAGDLSPQDREALRIPRLLLSAGAPVPVKLLRQLREILPSAQTQTPYGMTEAMPVATLDPTVVTDAGQPGVCVGEPVAGIEVGIAPLDGSGSPAAELTTTPGLLGEIVVRGAHVKDRYDRRWVAQRDSERPTGWHRTGDVGHLDDAGRLWVQGRLAHVISAPSGPVTPYPVEDRLRGLPQVADVAVVGVGPQGSQQVVVVLVPRGRLGGIARLRGAERRVLAPSEIAVQVREPAGVPVAAVLVRDWLPVDVRHASKVDRGALALWADGVLHGRSLTDRARQLVRPGAPRTRSR